MRILSFGSLNIDNVYRVKSIVQPGETIASGSQQVHCGGKGLNQSIALARAGMEVFHAGMIGMDGQILLTELEKAHVNTGLIQKSTGKSGHTLIQVDDRGQNSIILCGGTNQKITKEYVDEVLVKFQEGDLLLLQNEISYIDYIIARAKDKRMRILLNPSPLDEKMCQMDLSGVELFFLNEIEGEQITGEKDVERILNALSEKYPASKIVLTLGKAGAIFRMQGQTCRQNAIHVNAVDTTAAGDTFTGYFIKEFYNTKSPEKALALATKAAAIAVTKEGAAGSIPILKEVLDFK
ncbi:ribokinase [Anaerosacchariphilus polymeriproducens]|uniref:Ribokinase n=1 Tax=Anaerosacchariphilus polymeriproducens TaxID=1812858 RepID=A0A371ASN1_9FIRM|nr:ribokinase [Anaerosacchariphilus polymeriproducens]RDU22586.1 ribokinase [Anaerosacchariphilus polymeriproducens]